VAREGGPVSLSAEWRAWVAENLLRGLPGDELVPTLVGDGVPRRVAQVEVERIRRSALLRGANRLTRDLRRHALVARMRRTLASCATEPKAVDRRTDLSADEFFERYYVNNTPLILTDGFRHWPRLRSWTPSYLKEHHGEIEIEVSMDRDGDPIPDAHFKKHAKSMRLGELCDRVMAADATNDFYLVANNRVTKRPAFAALLEDVRAEHPYLDGKRDGDHISMWFGPKGTLTPLHHDTANVLFGQLFGNKRLLLYPPFELELLHDMHDGVYSSFDPENPDHEAFGALEGITSKEVILEPGDVLFIPVGWWHLVRALDVSISLSFTNFRRPNFYEYYYPGTVR
jgi:ribosomal protein L16 Arg81 hydroxylase